MRFQLLRTILLALSALLLSSSRASDVKRFELLKGVHFYQIAEGGAIRQTNNAYRFTVQVYADVIGDVLGASVYPPTIPRIDLIPDTDGDPYRFKDKFDGSTKFELYYPNGTYQLGIRGLHDGDHTMSFAINGNSYPAAPVVNNYGGLQNLIYNQYNDLSWQPFAGGTTNDYIQLQIEDLNGNNVWQTPDFTEFGALNGLDTHTILPAGTLIPGALYVGTLKFIKVIYSASRDYPNARGTVGYYTRTEFAIRPMSTGLSPLFDRLQIWRVHRFQEFSDGVVGEQAVPWQFDSQVDAFTNQVHDVGIYLPSKPTNRFEFDANTTLTQFQSHDLPITNAFVFASIYKDGPYKYEITRSDLSVEDVVVNLPAGVFPLAPEIIGPSSLTNHVPGEPITVSWRPWTNASGQDFIRVELFNEDGKIWDTSSYTSAKHLRPTDTTVTIGGTNFVAGHDYTLEVHFYHVTVSDTQLVPGAIVFGGFDSRTKFDFSTERPDVISFGVAEGQYFWQRSIHKYELDAAAPYRFEATAKGATANSLQSAQMITPTGRTNQLARVTTNVFQFSEINTDASVISQLYPPGAYNMTFQTELDGVRTSTAYLPPVNFPPPPIIINFTNDYRIGVTGDFTNYWAAWQDADIQNDKIRFTVTRPSDGKILIDSEEPGDRHKLSVTSTNLVFYGPHKDQFDNPIPGDLIKNQSYIVRLRFERRFKSELDSYPGARGTGVVFSETAFWISTFDNTFINTFNVQLTNNPAFPSLLQFKVPSTSFQTGRPYTIFQTHDFVNWTVAKSEALTNYYIYIPPPAEPTFFKLGLVP